MREVKAYLASQFGFSQTGKYILDNLIIPKIKETGIIVIDPFVECDKEFDVDYLESLEKYEDRKEYLRDFNKEITPINNRLMQKSDCLVAILDGGHSVDDGVASEIGYYAGIKKGPIFALRSDFRLGENMAVSINPQILGYIYQSGGFLDDCIYKFFTDIKNWHDSLVR